MQIEPTPEILKIQDKRYRVYKLDVQKYKNQVLDKNMNNMMISYSAGGWKNVDDEPDCNINREQKEKEIQKIRQEEQEKINNYKSQSQNSQKFNLFTHFISIPLNKPMLIQQIKEMQNEVKMDFLNPEKAHITLLMLNLTDQKIKQKLEQVMDKLYPKILGIISEFEGKPKLNLKGLGFFGESEKKARVLFIKIANQCRGELIINEILDLIVKSLLEQNIIQEKDLTHIIFNKQQKQYQLQKMHITLMKKRQENETVDLTNIIKQYSNFEIRNFIFDQLDVSMLNEFQENGYYQSFLTYNLGEQ